MNLKSIMASWVIAMCLLGLVSLLSQPVKNDETHQQQHLFMLPEEQAPQTEAQVTELEAKVWCALESNQAVQFQFRGKERQIRGSMGIAPDWTPSDKNINPDHLAASCEGIRYQQLAGLNHIENEFTGYDPALEFMFTTL